MENMGEWEQKNLVNELVQGKELAKHLQIHLNVASSSNEAREMLVQRILASYEKALSMLNSSAGSMGDQPQQHPAAGAAAIRMSESPPSLNGSPRSEDSDRDFKDPESKDSSRKRKSLPRWIQQVKVVSPRTGLEGPLDDGFSWRKYGQKDILGAKYPRGYYRCTHRNARGCLATKQVQRSDDDASIFEITYRGRHTCTQPAPSHLSPPPPAISTEPNDSIDINPQQQQSQEILVNFRKGLKVLTEDLETRDQKQFPSFQYFPSTSYTVADQNLHFSPSMVDNNLMGKFSPSFMSATTSAAETNYFMHNFGGPQNLHGSEFSTDIIPAATSATNSPTVGIDFPYAPLEFDSNFTFDNPGFFS